MADYLENAAKEARNLNQSFIGTEILLLALFGEEGGLAAQVLRKNGVSLETARAAAKRDLQRENILEPGINPKLTPKACKIIDRCWDAVRKSGKSGFDADVVLFFLISDEGSGAVKILRACGADIDTLRHDLVKPT